MINIHDLVEQLTPGITFLNDWKSAFPSNQDVASLDWLPYFYEAQRQMVRNTPSGMPGASGGIIYFPAGTYHFSATLHILRGMQVVGEGMGSTIFSIHPNQEITEEGNVVPQDGVIFHMPRTTSAPGTDELIITGQYPRFVPPFPSYIDPTNLVIDLTGVSGGSPRYNSRSDGTVLEKLTLDGNQRMRHGTVHHNGLITIKDCEIQNFQQDGIHIFGHVHGKNDLFYLYPNANPLIPTNASTWRVFNSIVKNCGNHGIYTFNLDSNAGIAQGLTCIDNGNYGIYDDSDLGNTYISCHAANNAVGNYAASIGGSGVNLSYFIGCSSDSGDSLIAKPSVVIGGDISYQTVSAIPDKKNPLVLEDSGTFDLKAVLRFMSHSGDTVNESRHSYLEFGGETGLRTLFSFIDAKVVPDEEEESGFKFINGRRWQLILHKFEETNPDNNYYNDGEWNVFTTANSPGFQRMAFAGENSKHRTSEFVDIPVEKGAIWFKNGYYLGVNNNYDEYIKVIAAVPLDNSGTTPDLNSIYPNPIGSDRKPKKGDIIFNSAPTIGGFSGWVCVKDFEPNTPEEWKTFGQIES